MRREQDEARFARRARTKWSGGPFRGPNARSTSDARGDRPFISDLHGRSPKLAAFAAFAGPLDLLTRLMARRSSLPLEFILRPRVARTGDGNDK
jgi:hypothetical protein